MLVTTYLSNILIIRFWLLGEACLIVKQLETKSENNKCVRDMLVTCKLCWFYVFENAK